MCVSAGKVLIIGGGIANFTNVAATFKVSREQNWRNKARLFPHRETKATITQQFMHACMCTRSHTHTHTFWWYTQYKVTWLLCRELSVHWQSTSTSCWNTMWPFLCVEEDQTIRRDCVSWEKLVRAQFTSDNVWLYDKSSTLPSVSFPSHPSLGMRHQRNIQLGRH